MVKSLLAFVANKGQNKGKRFVYSFPLANVKRGKAKLRIFNLMCDLRLLKAFWHIP